MGRQYMLSFSSPVHERADHMTEIYHYRTAARNTVYLTKLGVTHVLNTAEGFMKGTVNTSQVGAGMSRAYNLNSNSRHTTNQQG